MTTQHPPLRVGVCLSGGGFRAALYGLGALRYFAEAGSLSSVEVICGVSGGSIAAAAVIAGYREADGRTLDRQAFDDVIFAPFVDALDEHSIRNGALAKWLAQRWKPWGKDRGDVLGSLMTERLFPELRRLADLPSRPQLVITTTELSSGRAFRTSREFMGSWDYGYVTPHPEASVGRAVAASAAVPVAFPPLRMKTGDRGFPRKTPKRLVLVDGGVYDNIGLEWIQGWDASRRPPQAVETNFAIVINASGPLRPARRLWGALAWDRSRKVQYAQTQATRVRWLVDEFTGGRRRGVYLGITGDPRAFKLLSGQPIAPELYSGALPSALVPVLADLRTDLNRFRRTEAELLAYHGYWSAHARTSAFHPELATPGRPDWDQFGGMTASEEAKLVSQLSRPWYRFGVGSKLR